MVNLEGLLKEARDFGFTRLERHEVAQVYRQTYRDARMMRMDGVHADAAAYFVAKQFIYEQIDKWQRLDYEIRDKKHRRKENAGQICFPFEEHR